MIATHAPPLPLSNSIRIVVHGADTPRGRELAALLRLHPHVESAREVACDGSVLVGWDGAAEPRWSDGPGRAFEADVVFVCLPADDAPPVIMDAIESGARVVDLTGSLREAEFGLGIPSEAGDGETAYGLPEFAPERLRDADHVANAGSLATCATIALGPVALAGLLSSRVEVEATVGISRTPTHSSPTREEARDEIQENLSELHRCPREPRVVLDRRVDPAQLGVYTRTRLEEAGLTAGQVHVLYETFYRESPCVDVLPQGLPALPAAHGTNKVHVGIREAKAGEVEITSALDDWIKGTVGQAIQIMNVMCGFPETLGLPDFELSSPPAATPRAQRRPDL